MDLTSFFRLLLVISCVVVSTSFNVDLQNPVTYRGETNTGFGYKAEFLQMADKSTKLLVTAPNQKVTDPKKSGSVYHCTVLDGICENQYTPPEDKDGQEATDASRFGEDSELFGLAMTLADSSTAVTCGPMWSHLKWWINNRIFNVGRCTVSSSINGGSTTTSGTMPYFSSNPEGNYVVYVALNGIFSNQMKFGTAEFGFSAAGDGKASSGYIYNRTFGMGGKYITNVKSQNGKYLMHYGAADFGFSAAGDGAGQVVIGAPGFSVGRGGAVVLDAHTRKFHRMEMILDQTANSFLGYDVTVGNFCGEKRFCFAISDRQPKGKVYLIEYLKEERIKFLALWSMEGEQAYASFGSVLCAADVNGDGFADLLVGSPTHTRDLNDSLSYDEGRVSVLISQGKAFSGQQNFNMAMTLDGDKVPFSRFGSAIASIGDINQDSLNDIAVGAPMADDGAGVLYIYLGKSPGGPDGEYSQRIRGRDFPQPLKSFGSHISKPTTAFSSYGYPDFAVGAPASAAVMFFRTRLIVNARVSVAILPNPVDPVNQRGCPRMPGLDSVVPESACVTVRLCLNCTYTTGRDASDDQKRYGFRVDLTLDQLVSSDSSRRVRLFDAQEGQTVTVHSTLFNVGRDQQQCQNYTALLVKDKIARNPFRPINIVATFSLNISAEDNRTVAPILNQSLPTSHTEQLKLQNQCGADEVCRTDLVLTGQAQHVPRAASPLHGRNVVNLTRQVELDLDVANAGEKAFGFRITVNISGEIDLRIATGNTSILCDQVVGSELTCNSWTPLSEGAAVKVRLQFMAHTVPLTAPNKVITFQVKVMPSDPVANPEQKVKDNAMVFTSETTIISDLKLVGWADPRQLHVQDSDQGDVTLTHKLLVTNGGPSFLPPTSLIVRLPHWDRTGAVIHSYVNVTIKGGDGTVQQCALTLSAGGSAEDPTSTTATPTTTTTTPRATSTAGRTAPSGDSDDDPFGSINPNRRRRRQAPMDAQEGTVGSSSSSSSSSSSADISRMDCDQYTCQAYECSLPFLDPNGQVQINIKVSLLRTAISFPGNVASLAFTTRTSAVQPSHPLFFPWETQRSREVMTMIKRVTTAGINYWFIIGGLVGGLVILIIVVIVAWRCGCFRRNKKAQLERLKRQSGFYEGNRQSIKRRSQWEPSTNSGGANNEIQ